MYTVAVRVAWPMGHRLLNYVGPCQNIHGHNFAAVFTFESPLLDNKGMVVDFLEIKPKVKKWIDEKLDHAFMVNQYDPFLQWLRENNSKHFVVEGKDAAEANPTTEHLAKLLYSVAKTFIPENVRITKVEVFEGENNCAAWVFP